MIAYRYVAPSFSEKEFSRCGKFVAVVLNYNKKGLIGRAVKSALSQDFPCYEVLAQDDKSTDGSEKEMLAVVKEYVAAHPERALRITVVFNVENITILRQWKQAVQLSDGEWFGMFCGDDVAMPNRLEVATQTIARYPSACGFCTNYFLGDTKNLGRRKGKHVVHPFEGIGNAPEPFFSGSVVGCTAFWRRSVLELDLPRGNIDDMVLTWCAVIKGAGDLVWVYDEATVRYSVGTGVTTEDCRGIDENANDFMSLLRKYFAYKRLGRKTGSAVWDTIVEFERKCGSSELVFRQVRGYYVKSVSEGSGWFARLRAVWLLLVVDRGNDYGGMREVLAPRILRRFVLRLLGPFSYVAIKWCAGKLVRRH